MAFSQGGMLISCTCSTKFLFSNEARFWDALVRNKGGSTPNKNIGVERPCSHLSVSTLLGGVTLYLLSTEYGTNSRIRPVVWIPGHRPNRRMDIVTRRSYHSPGSWIVSFCTTDGSCVYSKSTHLLLSAYEFEQFLCCIWTTKMSIVLYWYIWPVLSYKWGQLRI